MTLDIFNMALHTTIAIPNTLWTALRIPGGWIYSMTDTNDTPVDEAGRTHYKVHTHSVFIPYSTQAKEERLQRIIE